MLFYILPIIAVVLWMQKDTQEETKKMVETNNTMLTTITFAVFAIFAMLILLGVGMIMHKNQCNKHLQNVQLLISDLTASEQRFIERYAQEL